MVDKMRKEKITLKTPHLKMRYGWGLIFPLFLILLSLACALPSLRKDRPATQEPVAQATQAPSPTPTQRALPPTLLESEPPSGSELPLQSLITLYFNQPMDRASVETALKVRAFLISDLIWTDDHTITIDPGQELPPDARVSIEVGTEARAQNGLSLREPVNLDFQTVGYLQLSQALPEPGSAQINPSSAVVAAFNHPIVPLGADPETLPPAFTLQPAAEGRGEWINTSTYIFYPEPALEGGKTYTISVDPTLHGIDGNPLLSPEAWNFSTAMPELLNSDPAEAGEYIRLDTAIILTFNQPMDAASLEANFRLVDPSDQTVPGTFEWSEKFEQATFNPSALLERSTDYRVEIYGQAQGRGGTPLGVDQSIRFRTSPELGVIATQPAQGGVLENYGSLAITFSSPIVSDNLEEYISIEPRAPNLSIYFSEADRTAYVYASFAPSTDYQLTISGDLTDLWGSKISDANGGPFSLRFRSAPLPPGIFVGTGSGVHFLRPLDNSLSAQVRGLSSLSITAGSVPSSDLIKILGENSYDFRRTYRPADQKSWLQPLTTNPDQNEQVEIYLSPDQEPLPPGLYSMRIDYPDYPGTTEFELPQLVVISDIHLTSKVSATDVLVWAVNLTNNMPIANLPITVYDSTGAILASGQTDEQGIFYAPTEVRKDPYSPVFVLSGQPGQEDFSLAPSYWNNEISPWYYGLNFDFRGPRQETYFYTDRPIYRPGQTVFFRGITRQAFNGRYELPEIKNLKVTLFDGNGQEIGQQTLQLSPFGTIQGEFNLPPDLNPGYYNLYGSEEAQGWISFQVAEYRKPEFNLQVDFSEEQVLAGQPLQATLQARYFFDAPVSNLPLSWVLYADTAYFDLPGYQVGLNGASQWNQRFNRGVFGYSVAQGEATTRPDGSASLEIEPASLELPPEVLSTNSRLTYTLEVTANDESGLPVSSRTSILVNPADYYIGLRSDAWIGIPEQQASFEVQTVAWDQTPAGSKDLRAEFSKVKWVRDESQSIDPYFGISYKPEFDLIGSTDFQTGPDGKARLAFTPPEPGTYQLSVFNRDDSGTDSVRSEILFWVGGPGQIIWPSSAEQRITLSSDRESYSPGDTAQVFVPNPLPGTTQALVTLERGKVLRQEVYELGSGGTTLNFPLTAEDAPNIYVAVTLLGQDPSGVPAVRQGFINLPVDPVEQTLNVQLIRQPEVTAPGDTLQVEIQVTDSDGKPVQGEFSLAVVDEAVLALADPNSINIQPAYYGIQPLGVQTAAPLTAYAQGKVEMPSAEGRGGGGGDGVPPTVRERFPDTAFWRADVVTDASGKATLNIPLPDSLTTWKIETRGLTEDTRVGQASSQVVTTKELLVRPVTPRFLVAGDHLELAAIVQNNTSQTVPGKAGLQAKGFRLDDPSTAVQSFSLGPGDRLRLSWWGTVEFPPDGAAQAELIFSAESQDGSLQDASRPSFGNLPILSYLAPQAFRTVGNLDEAGEQWELISLPGFYEPGQGVANSGNLEVEISPSLGAVMIKALEVLEESECQCIELTLSRLLSNLETYRAMQEFDLQSAAQQEQLRRSLDESLKTLITRQNFDGGWGWWPGDQSDPFFTAYALFGLGRARGAGIFSNEQPIQRAIEYLRTNLLSQPLQNSTARLDRLAFAHFALADAGAGDLESMNALYQERELLNPWAQALLALGLERTSPGSAEARTLISDLQAGARRSAAGAHWELSDPSGANLVSTLTNSAMVTYALAQRDPGAPLLADAVRYLVANRQAEGWWGSSFTTAWSVMALTEVMKATGEINSDYRFEASLNDRPIASGEAAGPEQLNPVITRLPLDQLYPGSPNLLTIERSVGLGRLYYSALLNVTRRAEDAPPLSKGLRLERRYLPASCEEDNCEAILSATVDEKVNIRLTLTVPRDSYYVMVQDFIPAGAEILNTNLKTSQLGEGDQPEVQLQYDPTDPAAKGWGWWYFRDPQIFDDHIIWAADYLPAGTYELSYTLVPLQAGEYQVLPARAWELYFPEVQGTSAGSTFTIK